MTELLVAVWHDLKVIGRQKLLAGLVLVLAGAAIGLAL